MNGGGWLRCHRSPYIRRVAGISYPSLSPGIGEHVRFLASVPRNEAFRFSLTYTGRLNGNSTDGLQSLHVGYSDDFDARPKPDVEL